MMLVEEITTILFKEKIELKIYLFMIGFEMHDDHLCIKVFNFYVGIMNNYIYILIHLKIYFFTLCFCSITHYIGIYFKIWHMFI